MNRLGKRKREQLEALQKQVENKRNCGSSGPLTPDNLTGLSSSNSPIDVSQAPIPSVTANDSECILPFTPPEGGIQFQEPTLNGFLNLTPSDSGSSLLDSSNFLDFNPEDPLLNLDLSTTTPDMESLLALIPPSPNSPAKTWQFLSNSANLVDGLNPDISASLQSHQTSTFTFPDDRIIDVPALTLLKAVLTVATRLNLTEYLWDLSGVSPFFSGSPMDEPNALNCGSNSPANISTLVATLPANYRPTPTQRLVPHHPILDLLPWPTVRDKLIQVFSLPANLRPAPAADPMGLVTLVYDIEDPTEGLRVSGSDPFMADMWEVGQLVFQRWWWAFESPIVERSNQLRKKRGHQGLVLELSTD